MTEQEVLKRLRDDSEYYGPFGKQYLSASNVKQLISKPTEFGLVEKTLALIQGRYFHLYMLEPDKINEIPVHDSKSRVTKAFKDFTLENNLDQYDVLLQKERDHMLKLCDKMKANLEISELVYDSNVQYEVPAIKQIEGVMWKGKCDVLNPNPFQLEIEDQETGELQVLDYPDGAIIDLKTSSDVHKFKWSCREYCYDAQAYIYSTLFNKPFVFIVVDKKNGAMKIAPTTTDFIDRGRVKVKKAVRVYNKFFSDDKTHEISNYVYTEAL